MANPTSNFNWQMPTASDLVTDLPADFEVFGQAVDTSLADLKGGTTDQVLAKNSNTDMDFKWVTSDDANAIQNSIVDAKGDLIAASANDTPARLAVGANGETLVADSSQTTGLRYNPQNALANPIINGGMDVWQRGTSFSLAASSGTTYVSDRWATGTGANQACTISRQATGDTTNLPNIQYALRYQRNSGQTGTGGLNITTSLETINTIPFAGKTVTMSFYARKGANYAPSTFNAYLITGTGTDQNRQSGGYTGENSSISASISLTTTWQRFVVTGTIPTTATEMAIQFFFDFTGTAGAADYFEITGFQVDLGTYTASTAPAFRRSQGTLQGELSACQRYFFKSPEMSVVPGAATSSGLIRGGTNASGNRWIGAFCLPVTMRVNPTCVVYNPNNGTAGQMRNEDANTNVTVSGIFGQYTNTVTQIDFSPTTSANNVVVGYITASAEL
jgi:hypothetical protein